MNSWKRMTALAGVLALLLTGCSAERVPDEVWLGLMEQEILARDGVLPADVPVIENSTEPPVPPAPQPKPTEVELPPATEAPPVTEAPATTLPPYNDTGDPVYDTMCHELEQYHNVIELTGDGVGQAIEPAYNRIGWERPDLFWVYGYTSEYLPTEATVNITLVDGVQEAQIPAMYEELMNTARSIASQAQAYATDYEKILFVHDYIIDHAQYDHDGMNSDAYGLWQTAYGCLVQGKSVCEGYADAFLLVMQQLDIPCGCVSGDAVGGGHAWNWVKLGGTYYWIDVTWDDPSSPDSDEMLMSHKYFLINDEMLSRSRMVDQLGYFVPECTSVTDNYYVRNNDYLESYRFEDIDGRLIMAGDDNTIEVMYSSADALQTAITDLFDNEHIWDTTVYSNGGGSFEYGHDDEMYTLMITYIPNA